MPNLDPAWIVLIGTLCGGIGLKVVEHWLGKSKIKIDEASQIRDELRLQLAAQKEEIRELEAEVMRWRSQYYDLRDQFTTLNTQYLIALEKIKSEAEQAAKTIDPPAQP